MKKQMNSAEPTKVFKLLWQSMTKKNKTVFFVLMLALLIEAFAILLPAQFTSIIISKLANERMLFFGVEISSSLSIETVVVMALSVTIVVYAFRDFYKLFIELLIVRVVSNMRMKAYSWVVTPRKNMDLHMTEGDASYRINDSCEYVSSQMQTLFKDLLPKIITGIVAFVYIIMLDILSLPIIIAGMLLISICVAVRIKIEKPLSVRREVAKSGVINAIVNSIANLSVINLYKSMKYEQKIFDSKEEFFYKQEKSFIKLRMFYWQTARIIEVVCTYSIIALCIFRSISGAFVAGSIVIILSYVSQILTPIQDIGYFTSRIVQLNIKIKRLQEIRPRQEDMLPLLAYEDKPIESLELKNIDIQNGDIFMIKDVNMKFNKGELTVMMGESGCGKSTIIRVLCGLCERISGDIIINGDERVDSMYPFTDYMSVTMQSPYIFNRNVRNNVLYPEGETTGEVKDIVTTLKMEELFVRDYNDKAQQNLEKMLSGGEKKRICISRGLIKKSKIYIFDEPTNDLDSKNAMAVIDYIEKCKQDGIVIVVTHDKRVVDRADQVIVINNKIMLTPDGKKVDATELETVTPETKIIKMKKQKPSKDDKVALLKPAKKTKKK